MKLFWKIYLAVVIPPIAIISLFTYIIAAYEISHEEKHVLNANMLAGRFIAKDIEKEYMESRWPFDSLKRLSQRDDFLFWWIVTDDGTIHLANDTSFIGTDAYAYFPQMAQISGHEKSFLEKKQNHGVFVKSFGQGGEWSFWLGFSLKELADLQVKIIQFLAVLLISTIGTLGIAVYFAVQYFTRPIKNLAEGAAIIGKGQLHHRVKIQSEDELGHLALSFNQMADDLEKTTTSIDNLNREINERKRAKQEIQRTSETQTVLNKLLGLSLENLTLEEMLEQAIYHITSISWLALESKGAIFLVEDDPQVLVMKAQRGLAKPLQTTCARVPFGRCMCGRAALSCETQFANCVDERHENRYDGIAPHGHYCVPIVSANKVLGVINMYVKDGHTYSKKEEDFLRAVSSVLAGIIERKHAEKDLLQSESKYRTLLENLPQKIFLKDTSSVYISCNESYARDLKIKTDEISGRTDYEFHPKELAEKYRADDKRIMQSGNTEELDEGYIQAGEHRLVHTVKTPIKNEQGDAIGILGIFWDVTERKRIEGELKSLKQQIEFILGTTKTGIDIIDSEFNIRYIDPEWQKVYGDSTGRKCYEYFMGRDDVCPGCGIVQALETKEITVTEEFLPKENNRPIQVTTMPFQNEQGEWLVAEVNTDITERKHAEQALEKLNRELEATIQLLSRSNKNLQDFVYIASHDLREPLRKISSFGRLLENSLKEKLVDDDRENLNFMVDGAERMTQMIEGLLTYSRVNTKDVAYQTVDVNKIIEQFRQLELATLLEETGATIEVPEPLPKVQADPVQIKQLLQNLIANGIKYCAKGTKPRIVIRAKKTTENKIRIEVQDNGIGIKKEYHDDIFTMFRRLHSREEYEGTGIGLSVCKKIVERHNGQIGVESEVGAGSTFWFTLPTAKEAAATSDTTKLS
jgi:PAS domain S-box-containing protein